MKKFIEFTPEEKLDHILKLKPWTDNYNYDKLAYNKKYMIMDIIKNWDIPIRARIKHIACLCNYEEDVNKIKDYYYKFLNKSVNEKRKRSLENNILFYGDGEGGRRYKEYCENNISKNAFFKKFNNKENAELAWKNRNKKISNKMKELNSNNSHIPPGKIDHWTNKGYSEEEAVDIIKNNAARGYDKAKNKIHLKGRDSCPWCIEYWIAKGHDESDSETKRKEFIDANKFNKENSIKKYGVDLGIKKYNDSKIKRYESMKNRIDGLSIKYDKSASKESMHIFFPLMDWLLENDYCCFNDIYVGIPDSCEYYIGSGINYYYLYDFTIPKFNLIIEYNGERWHPRPINSNDNLKSFDINGNDSLYLYNKDIGKINKAMERGFYLLEIWSYDRIESNLKKCKNFIKEIKNEWNKL